MPLTVTRDYAGIIPTDRREYRSIGSLAFDDSYSAGGESFTLGQLGFAHRLDRMRVDPVMGYTFEVDVPNKKVKVIQGDYSAAVDGPHAEVAEATNLATLVGARFEAYGW